MTAKDYLLKAQAGHFAIGAFNAANLETIKAIVSAAKKQNSPIIIEASHGEIDFIGAKNFVALIRNAREETGLPIFANLDHAPTLEAAIEGINLGFDLIHFNGSTLPYETNLEQSKKIIALAHASGVLVETELDTIPGGSSVHPKTAEEELAITKLTDPAQAHDFVNQTQTDTLAASFGSIHGLYTTPKRLDIERLKQIRSQTTCFLSLHGGSDMPDEQVKQAIQNGVVKVNVNSELRLTFRTTLEKTLGENKELAIYKIMPPVLDAVSAIVEAKISLFGSANQA